MSSIVLLSLGDRLVDLCQGARQELILVAPFIKRATLQRILAHVQAQVSVRCITRWRPDEIAAGVSDIEVWLLLKERPNSALLLRPDLHAKYYRADGNCLVGSANLTDAALGWSIRSNLEILVDLPRERPDLDEFEQFLMAGCAAVDESVYLHMRSIVESFPKETISPLSTPLETNGALKPDIDFPPPVRAEVWLPTLRHPENLYRAYSGKWDLLTKTSATAAASDLAALEIPPGLSQDDFEAYVGVLLLQKPIVRQVDEFLAMPQRFGAVREKLDHLLREHVNEFVAGEAWQTLMRWFQRFLVGRYRFSTPHHSEIAVRVVHQ